MPEHRDNVYFYASFNIEIVLLPKIWLIYRFFFRNENDIFFEWHVIGMHSYRISKYMIACN